MLFGNSTRQGKKQNQAAMRILLRRDKPVKMAAPPLIVRLELINHEIPG
jgi:hypothetical protein